MGGVSTGSVSREILFNDRTANVLRGTVRLDNQGGFIQMATNFVPTPQDRNSFRTATVIDASKFNGIELDVHSDIPDTFNVQ
jgi:Complex I intermediate-associated protein 30 (CIA30)